MTADWPPDLLEALRSARRVAVLTGAGISAESGIPTFRDAMTGLWARFRPEDLATADAFRRDPTLVWDWYEWRRELVAAARPNAGHRAVTALQRRLPACTVITQNVDGLHQDAGTRDVIELHGNIRRSKCLRRESCRSGVAGNRRAPAALPALRRTVAAGCGRGSASRCRRRARGGRAGRARDCDVLISIGTSAVVYPAAALPETALAAGGKRARDQSRSHALSGWPPGRCAARRATCCPRWSRPLGRRKHGRPIDDRPLRRGLPGASLGGAGALQYGGGLLHAARAAIPRGSALLWEDEGGATATWTYHALQQQANRLANALDALGVRRGDRVGIILPQRPETVVVHVACYQLGAVAMPLSILFGPEALEYRLQNSETVGRVRRPGVAAQSAAHPRPLPRPAHVIGVAGAREVGRHRLGDAAREGVRRRSRRWTRRPRIPRC